MQLESCWFDHTTSYSCKGLCCTCKSCLDGLTKIVRTVVCANQGVALDSLHADHDRQLDAVLWDCAC